jgi:hypothetical protein
MRQWNVQWSVPPNLSRSYIVWGAPWKWSSESMIDGGIGTAPIYLWVITRRGTEFWALVPSIRWFSWLPFPPGWLAAFCGLHAPKSAGRVSDTLNFIPPGHHEVLWFVVPTLPCILVILLRFWWLLPGVYKLESKGIKWEHSQSLD